MSNSAVGGSLPKPFFTTSAALLLSSGLVAAQAPAQATLTGTAQDPAGRPIPFATFLLVPAADTARVLQGVTSELAGYYTSEGTGAGTCRFVEQPG